MMSIHGSATILGGRRDREDAEAHSLIKTGKDAAASPSGGDERYGREMERQFIRACLDIGS